MHPNPLPDRTAGEGRVIQHGSQAVGRCWPVPDRAHLYEEGGRRKAPCGGAGLAHRHAVPTHPEGMGPAAPA